MHNVPRRKRVSSEKEAIQVERGEKGRRDLMPGKRRRKLMRGQKWQLEISIRRRITDQSAKPR